MQKLIRLSALAASIGALALAPAAMAQGGTGGGGTARPVSSGGGGGGGGGGVNSGGVKDVGATPPATTCATLTSVGAPVGYYSVWAAVWNDYSVKSCSSASENLTVTITNTNVATGAVEFSYNDLVPLTPGQNSSHVVDNDFAPFSTDYDVQIQVKDNKGTVLDTQSLRATTPPQK
jgi:hypothetical protein